MQESSLTLFAAFLAGIASVVTPCVIGLMPVYLSVLTQGAAGDSKSRFSTVSNALGFTMGFSAIFVLLGTGFGAIGGRLPSPDIMRKVAGSAMVLMGLFTSGTLSVPWLSQDRKLLEIEAQAGKPASFFGSALLGVAFSAGWSPCVGPVLASILALAGVSQNAVRGATLLLAYSFGLALPFLAASFFVDRFKRTLPSIIRFSARLRTIAGILMVLVGILYLTGLL